MRRPPEEWRATDYQRRTPEQIIERRAGNCADLASVLARLLGEGGVRHRLVPKTRSR